MSDTMTTFHEQLGMDLPLQLHVGDRPTEGGFKPIVNGRMSFMLKPEGGLWTSSIDDEGQSDWIRWCKEEDFVGVDVRDWWALVPSVSARVAVIDSAADLAALIDAFPDPTGCTSDYLPDRLLDFDAMMASGLDGLRLTIDGHLATRYGSRHHTYAWDCESTVWFRWCFTSVDLYRKGEDR